MPMPRRRPRAISRFEALEGRALLSLSPLPDVVVPFGPNNAIIADYEFAQPLYSSTGGGETPYSSSPPGSALTPAQIKTAYDYPTLSNAGAGQTIDIVDAYNDPDITSDLAKFSTQYGLPQMTGTGGNPSFTVHEMSSRVSGNTGWGEEIALDVEWAHAIAPAANIVLVEATNSSLANLMSAVTYASSHGASVVSMSWGGSESSSQLSYDPDFTTAGVTYVAASGDESVVGWPATSPSVVAVGGTTLTLGAGGTYGSETTWSGSGGGISTVEAKPSYQTSPLLTTKRGNPDVAYDANPNTGVAVYDSYGGYDWFQVGGTSAGSPQWAALIAIADGERTTGDLSSLQTLDKLYSIAGTSDFHDITTGGNGHYNAGPGYDLVTGNGTPDASKIIAALVSA